MNCCFQNTSLPAEKKFDDIFQIFSIERSRSTFSFLCKFRRWEANGNTEYRAGTATVAVQSVAVLGSRDVSQPWQYRDVGATPDEYL